MHFQGLGGAGLTKIYFWRIFFENRVGPGLAKINLFFRRSRSVTIYKAFGYDNQIPYVFKAFEDVDQNPY